MRFCKCSRLLVVLGSWDPSFISFPSAPGTFHSTKCQAFLDSNVAKCSSFLCFGCLCQYVVWLACKPLPLHLRRKGRREDARSVSLVVVEGLQLGTNSGVFNGFTVFLHLDQIYFAPLSSHQWFEFFLEAQWCQRTGSSETTALANAQSKIHSCKQLIVGICCYCLLYPPQALNALRYQTALQL